MAVGAGSPLPLSGTPSTLPGGGSVPPPKSSKRVAGAPAHDSPMRPPRAANGQPATDTLPSSAPLRNTWTLPSSNARAPNRSPAVNVTPPRVAIVAQVAGGENVDTTTLAPATL